MMRADKVRSCQLSCYLKRLKEKLKGEILEIELDDKDGRLYYEIYYLDSAGPAH